MKAMLRLLLVGFALLLASPAGAWQLPSDCNGPGQSINWSQAGGFACQQGRIVSRAIMTTDSNGQVTFTYPTRADASAMYTTIPAVAALPVSPSGTIYSVYIVSQSVTAVTLGVKQARTLPATIGVVTNLVSYNVFNDPATGITLNISASGN